MTCQSGYLYYNNNCYNSGCPTGSLPTGDGLTCTACTPPCTSCHTTATTCDSCQTGYYFDSDYNECVLPSDCPNFTLATTVGSVAVCANCTGSCASCATTTSTCTSCTTGTYLYQSSCLAQCPVGTIALGSDCVACTSPCSQCAGTQTNCTSCTSGTYLYDNYCYAGACPAGTFVNAGSVCEDCTPPCLNCTGFASTCTACTTGNVLANSVCSPACPGGMYVPTDANGNDLSQVCLACSSSCATCTSGANNCTSCSSGANLYDNTCIASCPDGYYANNQLHECLPCNSTCANCVTSPYICTSCPAGTFLDGNECVSLCPDATFVSGTSCAVCSQPCYNCNGTSTTCTSCTSGFLYDSVCYPTCPAGSVQADIHSCATCDPNCATCSVTTTRCTSCPVGLLLYNEQCIDTCPAQTFVDGSQCSGCNLPCFNCTGTAGTCESCETGYLLSGSSCLSTCASGTFSSSGLCLPCTPPCSNCDVTATTCTTCATGLLWNSTCVASCPDGTLSIDGGVTCSACDPTCATCGGGNLGSCTTCIPGLLMHDEDGYGQCLSTCPDGSVQVSDTLCALCDTEQSFCINCDNNSTTSCTSCANGYELFGTVCLSTCPIGTTAIGPDCATCDAACTVCNGTVSTCSQCATGYFLYVNTTCVSSCPVGSFPNGGLCEACSPECQACDRAPDTCTACYGSDVLDGLTCVAACPAGTYQDGSNCYGCQSPCATCEDASTYCTSCQNNFLLFNETQSALTSNTTFNNTCFAACPANMVQIGGQCVLCDASCATCSSSPSFCTSCAFPVDDFLTPDGQCLATCPTGTTPTNATGANTCVTCTPPCSQCAAGNPTQCTQCVGGASVLDGVCWDTCPTGYVADVVLDTCVACTANCSACESTTSTCLSCVGSTSLSGTSCVSICPGGTFSDTNGICQQCDPNCEDCVSSSTTCTRCPDSDTGSGFLYGTTCVSTCPDGTYEGYQAGLPACLTCQFPCATCSQVATFCNTCVPGNVLYQQQCFGSCPVGTAATDNSCELIPPSCPATALDNGLFNATTVAGIYVTGQCDPGFEGSAMGFCSPDGTWDDTQFVVDCNFTVVVSGGDIANLTATYIDSSSVTLTWAPAHNSTGGVLRYLAKLSSDGQNFVQIFTGGALRVPTVTATGLQQDTLYYFQVFGYTSNNVDLAGAQITATTNINPPGSLYVSNITASDLVVSWTLPADSLAKFFLVNVGVMGSQSAGNDNNSTKRSLAAVDSTFALTLDDIAKSISKRQQPVGASNWTLAATLAASGPNTVMVFHVTGLQALTSYVLWVQASLDRTHPEPVGSAALVTTTKDVVSSSSIPTSVIAGVVVAICIILLLLLLALVCYRRRVAQRQKQILEDFGTSMGDLSSFQVGHTIPDNVAVGFDGKHSSDVTKTHTQVVTKTDATMVNTVLEVALPGFLKLDYATDLRTERMLTQGGVGTIWQAQLLDNQLAVRNGSRVVVLKHIEVREGMSAEEHDERFHQEVSIMWALAFHPNIIKLVGYTDEPRSIVTPLYKTDLFRFLHNQEDKTMLPSDLLLHLCAGIMAGMDAVHSIGIAHRDIKSPNILMAEPQAGGIYPHPVLCDFGLSRTEDDSAVKKSAVVNGLSPRYAAPEVFARLHLRNASSSVDDDKRSDMYSIGVTFWETLTRRIPWDNSSAEDVEAAVRSGGRLEQVIAREKDDVQILIVGIIDQCLQPSHVRRPTANSCNNKLNDLMLLRSEMPLSPLASPLAGSGPYLPAAPVPVPSSLPPAYMHASTNVGNAGRPRPPAPLLPPTSPTRSIEVGAGSSASLLSSAGMSASNVRLHSNDSSASLVQRYSTINNTIEFSSFENPLANNTTVHRGPSTYYRADPDDHDF